jgi:hypothetical protein
MDLFRLPLPGSRPVTPAAEEKRNGDSLPDIPEQFNPAAQAEIRSMSAGAATTSHDGWMRVLVFGPLGVATAMVAELPLLPVLGFVAAGVAIASWLDRPEPSPPAPDPCSPPAIARPTSHSDLYEAANRDAARAVP